VFAFSEPVYSILSKNASSSPLTRFRMLTGYSKKHDRWRNGASLTGILQVIDLDHPDAPKIVNLLSKALVLWKARQGRPMLVSKLLNPRVRIRRKLRVSSERHDEQSRICRGDHRA
ncbi:unnamed protein product, partial [Dovyalis caffra]